MMSTSSAEHITRCLTELRAAVRSQKLTTEEQAAQLAVYAKHLMAFHPQAVKRGCERMARTQAHFPSLSELLRVVQGEAEVLDGARQGREAGINVNAPALAGPSVKPKGTPEDVREDMRLVELMREHPENYVAAPALIAMGERLICDAIAEGRAPRDVLERYVGPMVEVPA